MASGLAATAAAAAVPGLDVRVEGVCDYLVRLAGLMLVDDRGPLAVVTHPRHQVRQPGAAAGGQVVSGVPEIVKVQAFRADRADRMRPA